MSSIIKVDTIQNQSGANIISESANTITVGASGDTVTIPSGGTLGGAGTFDLSSGSVTLNDTMKMTPAFFAYMSGDQNISNNTMTKIQYNTEDFDTNSMYDNSSNYRFTPTIAGKYFVYACATISAAAYVAYATQLNIRKNGGDYIVNRASTANDALFELTVHCSGVIDFNGSSDYVEVFGLSERHTGSAQQKFVAANRRSNFGAYKVIGA